MHLCFSAWPLDNCPCIRMSAHILILSLMVEIFCFFFFKKKKGLEALFKNFVQWHFVRDIEFWHKIKPFKLRYDIPILCNSQYILWWWQTQTTRSVMAAPHYLRFSNSLFLWLVKRSHLSLDGTSSSFCLWFTLWSWVIVNSLGLH